MVISKEIRDTPIFFFKSRQENKFLQLVRVPLNLPQINILIICFFSRVLLHSSMGCYFFAALAACKDRGNAVVVIMKVPKCNLL